MTALGKRSKLALVSLGLVAVTVGVAWTAGLAWFEGVGADLFGDGTADLQERYEREGERFDHGRFTALLQRVVDGEGLVDYEALHGDPSELDAYLEELAAADYDGLSRDGKLALLINAYNAFTLRLITDHWPVQSIQDIPGDQRWDAARWTVGGETLSLSEIEHERIRGHFREPRIHFAINCAARSCPPLARVAYEDETLDADLQRAAERTHTDDTRWFDLKGDEVRLSRIYLWFDDDFLAVADSLPAYAARFNDRLADRLAVGEELGVAYLDYDWSLNSQGSAPAP